MPKTVSGAKLVRILCKRFGFVVISQKGSHMKLSKSSEHQTLITVIPQHRELATGTLRGCLKLAHLEIHDVIEFF
jgi:predicted RNA binding protein YcfA (HicA-like mRNA interferase family)